MELRVLQVWSARAASKQEGRSESERTSRRKALPQEADLRRIGVAKSKRPLLDGQSRHGRTEEHVSGLPAEAEGGNSGKYSSESPEGEEVRQDDP